MLLYKLSSFPSTPSLRFSSSSSSSSSVLSTGSHIMIVTITIPANAGRQHLETDVKK